SGIKNGDLVFMTSMGSNWIGLWENFTTSTSGCTIADASQNPTRYNPITKANEKTKVVEGAPKGVPPVTHIGVYYDGKIYHQIGRVVADDLKFYKLENQTRVKTNWKNIYLTGYFAHEKAEFIAGYGFW
ncbi:MAG: hypothetical protein Q7J14_00785, partial [Candidatus Magasanikbacteria bacterium]|nr:hypothetical protein [Candidatus Magasanikbacteria bacterium]